MLVTYIVGLHTDYEPNVTLSPSPLPLLTLALSRSHPLSHLTFPSDSPLCLRQIAITGISGCSSPMEDRKVEINGAVLVGLGAFTATGLALLGGWFLYRRYSNYRDDQLLQQADDLFSNFFFHLLSIVAFTPTLTFLLSHTLTSYPHQPTNMKDNVAQQNNAGNQPVTNEMLHQLQMCITLLDQVGEKEKLGNRAPITHYWIHQFAIALNQYPSAQQAAER